jgi:hypothetical protein
VPKQEHHDHRLGQRGGCPETQLQGDEPGRLAEQVDGSQQLEERARDAPMTIASRHVRAQVPAGQAEATDRSRKA